MLIQRLLSPDNLLALAVATLSIAASTGCLTADFIRTKRGLTLVDNGEKIRRVGNYNLPHVPGIALKNKLIS